MKAFRTRRVAQVGLLIFISVAIFGNTFTGKLIWLTWDDIVIVGENRYVHDCKNIPLFFTPHYWNTLHPFSGQYRPLRAASLAVDFWIWKTNPAGYRLTNVLLHTINVVLVFFLVTMIMKKRSTRLRPGRSAVSRFAGPAFLTALFFAAHPIHTETINFIKNRSDLLACLFFLLSTILFVAAFSATVRKFRCLLIAGAWLLFIPAVLAKEMAVTLPGVLALYVICFMDGGNRVKNLIRLVPFGAIIIVYIWFTQAYISPADPLPYETSLPEGLLQQTLTVIKTTGFYFKLLLVPFPLNVEHAFTVPVNLWRADVLMSLVALLIVVTSVVLSYRRAPIVSFSIGWILLTLVPVVNLVYLAQRPIAEQRLYIPSFGLCLLLGYGIDRLAGFRAEEATRRWPVLTGRVLAAVIFILYAVVSFQRNCDWRNEIAFYSSLADVNPQNARFRYDYGNALSSAGNYEEAIRQYKAAVRINPGYMKAHYNLGVTYYKIGHHDKAVHHYRAVLALEPGNIDALNNMGAAFYAGGRLEAALACFREVLRLAPDDVKAEQNMKDVLVDLGRSVFEDDF